MVQVASSCHLGRTTRVWLINNRAAMDVCARPALENLLSPKLQLGFVTQKFMAKPLNGTLSIFKDWVDSAIYGIN